MQNGLKRGSLIYRAVCSQTHKMIQKIGIFGTSGMARETQDIAQVLGFSVVFVASNSREMEEFKNKDQEVILESDIERFSDIPYVIGIGECATRRHIAIRFAGKIRFCNLIHPSATFGRGQRELIESKQGVIVCAGVRFTSNISIGDFTIFNLNATISHDCIVGDFVTVSPQSCVLGNVEIKTCAWIGAGSIINQGSNLSKRIIGENAIIGSGAVVLQDCDPRSTYVGSPARKVD